MGLKSNAGSNKRIPRHSDLALLNTHSPHYRMWKPSFLSKTLLLISLVLGSSTRSHRSPEPLGGVLLTGWLIKATYDNYQQKKHDRMVEIQEVYKALLSKYD